MHDVSHNGDCQFDAISHQLSILEPDKGILLPSIIRARVCDYILEHEEEFNGFVVLLDGKTFKDYIKTMSINTTFVHRRAMHPVPTGDCEFVSAQEGMAHYFLSEYEPFSCNNYWSNALTINIKPIHWWRVSVTPTPASLGKSSNSRNGGCNFTPHGSL